MEQEQERELVMVSEAAALLGVSVAAIHWHIKNSGVFTQSFGDASGRKATFYLVDMVELRKLVKGGTQPEAAPEPVAAE